jgi:hypothetical protein
MAPYEERSDQTAKQRSSARLEVVTFRFLESYFWNPRNFVTA